MSKKIRLQITGMTCVNCQNKIEKKLTSTKGGIRVKVSYNKASAEIEFDEKKTSPEALTRVIQGLGYGVDQKKAGGPDLDKTMVTLAVIIWLYAFLQHTGILNLLAPSQLADTKMGYGMLFVIGLITSVHCIAMCGGINLSQCLPQKSQEAAQDTGKLAAFRPALAYNMGRVVSYTAVGFVLGLVGFLIGGGSEVGLSTFLQGILKILAGVFMVVMGINMLGLFPWLRKFTIRMPKFLAKKVGERKAHATRPFIVGILNGFMPCGPLQSMWIVALASGNPFSGALSMFLFSLGTVPLMLGLGSIVAALGKKFTDKVMSIGAVLVVVLGLAMISQGGSLNGMLPSGLLMTLIIAFSIAGILLSIPARKKVVKWILRIVAILVVIGSCALWHCHSMMTRDTSTGEANSAQVSDGVQVVNSTLTSGSYPNITVQAGIPVKWVIYAPEGSINGCNNRMLIRDLGIEYTFHTGENVIEFTPTQPGTISYSCWMGMIQAYIFVTDGTEGTLAVGAEVSIPTASGYVIPTETMAIASLTTDESGNQLQQVSVELTDNGFEPAIVVAQAGTALYWNIENNRTDAAAGTELFAPYYSTKLSLTAGSNQLGVYPSQSFDVYTGGDCFFCYVKVVDDLNAIDEDAIREEVSSFITMIYPAEVFEGTQRSCCG